MTKSAISAALHMELSEQLEKQLDSLDDLADARSAINGALGREKKRLLGTVTRIRRQLKGQDLPQKQIPGTEVGEPKRDPVLLRLIASARELAEEVEEKEAGPGLPPIEWKQDGEGALIAETVAGRFEIQDVHGEYELHLIHSKGRCRVGGNAKKLDDAKAEAGRYLLEVHGDQLLANAGSADLTKRALKGPAVARKKGRR